MDDLPLSISEDYNPFQDSISDVQKVKSTIPCLDYLIKKNAEEPCKDVLLEPKILGSDQSEFGFSYSQGPRILLENIKQDLPINEFKQVFETQGYACEIIRNSADEDLACYLVELKDKHITYRFIEEFNGKEIFGCILRVSLESITEKRDQDNREGGGLEEETRENLMEKSGEGKILDKNSKRRASYQDRMSSEEEDAKIVHESGEERKGRKKKEDLGNEDRIGIRTPKRRATYQYNIDTLGAFNIIISSTDQSPVLQNEPIGNKEKHLLGSCEEDLINPFHRIRPCNEKKKFNWALFGAGFGVGLGGLIMLVLIIMKMKR